MRPIVLLLLALLPATPIRLQAAEGDAPAVLITAFQPFAQRSKNGSATVAGALGKELSGVNLHIDVMPVRWGEPERRLPMLVAQHRPRLLIGLGEGQPGSVAVERVARNQAWGADTADQSPRHDRLLPDGPHERRSTLLFEEKWPLSREVAVTTSDDAGQYLCNALLYAALAQPVERIGFIHLPPQGNEPDAVYAARFVPVIAGIVRRNLGLRPDGP